MVIIDQQLADYHQRLFSRSNNNNGIGSDNDNERSCTSSVNIQF